MRLVRIELQFIQGMFERLLGTVEVAPPRSINPLMHIHMGWIDDHQSPSSQGIATYCSLNLSTAAVIIFTWPQHVQWPS